MQNIIGPIVGDRQSCQRTAAGTSAYCFVEA